MAGGQREAGVILPHVPKGLFDPRAVVLRKGLGGRVPPLILAFPRLPPTPCISQGSAAVTTYLEPGTLEEKGLFPPSWRLIGQAMLW